MEKKIREEIKKVQAELREAADTAVGKCEISVGADKHCFDLTEKSCYKTASEVGGVATWTANAKC